MSSSVHRVSDLLHIMKRLRDPATGCPWDLAQGFETIVPSTLEECYELAAAIEARDYAHVKDELGDVLFQVVFYAQLGAEAGHFTFDDVVQTLVEKLLRRHPHVFGDGGIDGEGEAIPAEAVKGQWEAIKAAERAERAQHGVLDDVPVALPALPRAQKLQKRAARVGFDWDDSAPVLEKLDEELAELREALAGGDPVAVEEELGDLLFTAVNLARHQRLDAESCLRRASARFERRFRLMEKQSAELGRQLDDCDSAELEALWENAKHRERGS
jgi:ATP diphosphatase